MKKISNFFAKLNHVMLGICGAFIAIATFLASINAVLRFTKGSGFDFSDEMCVYLIALMVFLAMGYLEYTDNHLTIDIFNTSVKNPVVLILLILVALNCPIWVAIFGATIYLQVFVNHMNLNNLFTGIFEACTKTSLLAVPYFILAGSIIASSSLGRRLINIFIALLKNVRGGLAIACLVANAIFGAISGSAPAATATFGKVVYEPLKEAHGKKCLSD